MPEHTRIEVEEGDVVMIVGVKRRQDGGKSTRKSTRKNRKGGGDVFNADANNSSPSENNSTNTNITSTNSPVARKGGKRAPNKYMKFAGTVRTKLMGELGDVTAVAKRTGEMWRGMSEAEKAKY